MSAPDLASMAQILLTCGMPIALLLVGLIAGRTLEMLHFRRLARDEEALLTIPLTDLRQAPGGCRADGATLVSGSVVVASDYLKTFLASLRNIIGGEVRSFERLMERARREAVCRVMRDAHAHGAVAVINLRFETSNIGRTRGSHKRKIAPMVEVIAYGTALLPPGHPAAAIDVTLPCPSCGYALLGKEERGCPECGWGRPDAVVS